MASPLPKKKRVKSGCVTCRIRRVKCDEGRPFCQNCIASRRICGGYSSLLFTRRELAAASSTCISNYEYGIRGDEVLPRLTTDPTFSDVLEKRYFQFFRHSVANDAQHIGPFWSRVVLQASHTEPAVKHIVLALSSLIRSTTMSPSEGSKAEHIGFAATHHQKALAETRVLVTNASPQDVNKVLIACVIFIAFDAVLGHYHASLRHLQCGRAIVSQHLPLLQQASRSHELQEIEQTLFRLDIPAISFQDNSTSIRLSLDDFHKTNPNLQVCEFKTLAEARTNLFELVRWLLFTRGAFYYDNNTNDPIRLRRLLLDKAKCAAQLRKWRSRFEDIVKSLDDTNSCNASILRLWYTTSIIISDVDCISLETIWDGFVDDFNEIITSSEKLAPQAAETGSFSLEVGYIIPVFFAILRCRDPTIRRRGLALLRDYPRQEGSWQSCAAAAIAEKVVEYEESGLETVNRAHDIPEELRVHILEVAVDVASTSATMRIHSIQPTFAHPAPSEFFVTW